jgi:hypothetical protein
MAEIINLRQARKRKGRAEKERSAEANRLKFGRTRDERRQGLLEQARAERAHEAHRRDDHGEV